MTQRIKDFLAAAAPASPCLVVDLEVVAGNFDSFRAALPEAEIFYAVKANPDPAILSLLASRGSSFDCASVPEIQMALDAGVTAARISFGNTIKKEADVARAFALGVRLFAVDCVEEVEKVVRSAPGSSVFCRILTDGEGAEWPLSRKFGCSVEMAATVLATAAAGGLDPVGVSFHVGSQQTDLGAWDRALRDAKAVFDAMKALGFELRLVNMGGGFPTRYLTDVPSAEAYGFAISSAVRRHFGEMLPRMIIEPGRGMVGSAGVLKAEVVLVSRKDEADPHRWVFLDVGKFGGLAETMDEAIRYRIVTSKDGGETAASILAGPTCDSADVLYERKPYDLPLSLQAGDEVLIEGAGAYTTTYSAVAFNGFDPLRSYVI